MSGTDLIALERHRQIAEEGYDAAHDAGHADELADAAAAYAVAHAWRGSDEGTQAAPPEWPWSLVYWKPTPNDRIRELVKAGALIAAAIDSIQGVAREQEPDRDAESGERLARIIHEADEENPE